ncbi:hypothetical protein COO60DRAFT_1623830 [Scenedesmus sp. NREL 46B-D3]|nr:hypothetical protein COO60DRAFT_1623830 [Scenedesmus sp. NREL 46B-D3]
MRDRSGRCVLTRWPEALAAFLQAWSRSELAGMAWLTAALLLLCWFIHGSGAGEGVVPFASASNLSPVRSWEQLKTIGPCWGLARGYGRTDVYYKLIIIAWVNNGRKRMGFYNAAAASSNKPKVKSVVLYIEAQSVLDSSNSPQIGALLLLAETHDVVTIADLGDGCLYAFNSPLQPGDVQEELLPPHMQAIISKPPGSLSKANRKRFRHKGVRLGHLHDTPTLQEPLYLHVKEGRINANGQPPANFTSHEQRDKVSFQVLEEIDIGGLEGLVMFQAHQMRDSPEKAQRFLDVMRAAGASGLVPELSRWASLPPADSSSSLCRPGKKRKLAKPVPQLPVDAAAAPFAEPAIGEAAAAPIVWTMTTCKPGSSGSNAARAASSSAGLTAMLGAAVALLALSAEAVLGAGDIPQQLLDVDSSSPGVTSCSNDPLLLLADTSSTVAAAADMMDTVYNSYLHNRLLLLCVERRGLPARPPVAAVSSSVAVMLLVLLC